MWHDPLDYPCTRRGAPSGATETTDFAELVEICFTGMISPKGCNIIYGVLKAANAN